MIDLEPMMVEVANAVKRFTLGADSDALVTRSLTR